MFLSVEGIANSLLSLIYLTIADDMDYCAAGLIAGDAVAYLAYTMAIAGYGG